MIFAFDDFELDAEHLELRRAGELVKAELAVLRLLAALVQNPGRLVTNDELVQLVWDGRAVAENVITVSMARLRKTLHEHDGELVSTVYGRGYRFVRPVTRRTPSHAVASLVERAEREPPLVGRARVLEQLHAARHDAADGHGRLSVLMGEPGSGKTCVVEAFQRELRGQPVQVVWGFCREGGDTPPLWPWLRLVREVLALTSHAESARLNAAAEALEARMRDLEPVDCSERLTAWNAGAPGETRRRLFDVVLSPLVRAAEQTPWVLVLDDLHRADAASLELLNLLVDEIAQTRLLVIATLRDGRDAQRPETRLPRILGHRNCERIRLTRLREEEVSAYVAALIDDSDGERGRAVFARSEGNPFFMAELARQLREGNPHVLDRLTVPSAALDLVRQRLTQLDAETRDVLAAAAVVGRTFDLPLLRAVTGRDPLSLARCLEHAIAAEVVVAAPDSRTGFAFGHSLLRSVLHDELSSSDRRAWHLRVGEALEHRMRAGDAVPPSELAYHYYEALPEADPRKVVHFCRMAARAAAAVFASGDVMRYVGHALEALSLVERPSVRLRMSLLYMQAMYSRGHSFREYVRITRELLQITREQACGPMLVRAALLLNLHPGLKALPGGGEALSHALTLLKPEDLGMRSVALAALACAAPHCFDAVRAEALIREAVALARRSRSRAALYAALVCKLYVQGGPAHADATTVHDELSTLAHRNPDRMPLLQLDLALYRAILALQRGDMHALAQAIERGSARASGLHHGEFGWHWERFHALARIVSGAWTSGIGALEALHRNARQQGIFGTEPFCAFDAAVILGELTNPPPLDATLLGWLEPMPSDPPIIWAMKVRALAAAGRLDEARAALALVSPTDLARLPCDSHYLGTLGHLTLAALTLEASDYYERLYELLEPYPTRFAAGVSFWCEGSISQLLGMLARALGRHASAQELLDEGIRLNERAGYITCATEARFQLARSMLERGLPDQRERAIALVRDVCGRSAHLGMARLLRSATTLLWEAESS